MLWIFSACNKGERRSFDLSWVIVAEIFKSTVSIILVTLQIAMTARAILSWFPVEQNKFIVFLNVITEPIVYPVRKLFEKMNWFQGIPLDMSFMTTYLIISIILLFLA